MKEWPWWHWVILACCALNLIYVVMSAVTGVPVLALGRNPFVRIPSVVLIPIYGYVLWQLIRWKYAGAILGGLTALPFAIGGLIDIFVSIIRWQPLVTSRETIQGFSGLLVGLGSIVMAALLLSHLDEYSG